MTEVILDGKGAGMTAAEYEEMRKLDCGVAVRLGWHSQGGADWQFWCIRSSYLRDEDDGVPFYSLDANGAFMVLQDVCRWRYASQQIFFNKLQELAGFDKSCNVPIWPDAFISLIPDFPKHVCAAFLASWQWMDEHNIHPFRASKQANDFAESQVETAIVEEVDEETGLTSRKAKITAISGAAPWVH